MAGAWEPTDDMPPETIHWAGPPFPLPWPDPKTSPTTRTMDTSPGKIDNGMRRQLRTWRDSVAARQQRLGWKTGFTLAADQQRLNLPSAMVGFLSRERCYRSGERYRAAPGALLLVEPEVAVRMGADVPAGASAELARAAIAAYAGALELVDTTRSVDDDMEAILAGNLFHDGVVLAASALPAPDYRREHLGISLRINGREVRTLEPARVPEDFSAIVLAVANTLAAHGEQLQKGDWIITGAATRPAPVAAGDEVEADMGVLGTVAVRIDR
jgi:2-oxo-hept-3-ene-1,7-dioate hydratase